MALRASVQHRVGHAPGMIDPMLPAEAGKDAKGSEG